MKATAKKNKISYKEAMSIAKTTYKPKKSKKPRVTKRKKKVDEAEKEQITATCDCHTKQHGK